MEKVIENLLKLYSIEELLELSDTTEEEAIEYLINQGLITVPTVQPVD